MLSLASRCESGNIVRGNIRRFFFFFLLLVVVILLSEGGSRFEYLLPSLFFVESFVVATIVRWRYPLLLLLLQRGGPHIKM